MNKADAKKLACMIVADTIDAQQGDGWDFEVAKADEDKVVDAIIEIRDELRRRAGERGEALYLAAYPD